MRHPFITAQLLRQAQAPTTAEASELPAQNAIPDHCVRRLLVWSAAILLVAALVAPGVPLPAGAAHARLADERAEHALERTPAREHHAGPSATSQQATSAAEPAAPSRTRPPLVAVVVGAARLMVVLAAAVTLLRQRARPQVAT